MKTISRTLLAVIFVAASTVAFACGTIQSRAYNYRQAESFDQKITELTFINCPSIIGQEMTDDDLEMLSRMLRSAFNDAIGLEGEDKAKAKRLGDLALITYFTYREQIVASDDAAHEVHESIADYLKTPPGETGLIMSEVEYTEKERQRFDPDKFEDKAIKLRSKVDAVIGG